jgi:nicotinamidase-related amidase
MALDPHKTALLVIDVQNEYFGGKWPIPDGSAALSYIEEAIDASQRGHSDLRATCRPAAGA